MVSAEMQNKFDNLNENDFIEIAQSAAESVMEGKVNEKILVNLSSPDVMMFDPVVLPEYKHLTIEYKNGIMIELLINVLVLIRNYHQHPLVYLILDLVLFYMY